MGTGIGKAVAPALDITGYRERAAAAVGMDASELIAPRRDDPRAALLRMIAAYLLLEQEQLSVAAIAKIMEKSESYVRDSTDYISRRAAHYYAFSIYIQRTIAAYALANAETGKPTGQVLRSGVDIAGARDRLAAATEMTVKELVASDSDDQDAEMIQRVGAYLLVARDRLPLGEAAVILNRTPGWVGSAKEYVERQVKRNADLRAFVESAAAKYALGSGGT